MARASEAWGSAWQRQMNSPSLSMRQAGTIERGVHQTESLSSSSSHTTALGECTFAAPRGHLQSLVNVAAEVSEEERLGFAARVEKELQFLSRAFQEQRRLQLVLQHQVEGQGKAWRGEATALAEGLEQLRGQVKQTMEAAVWSGQEASALRQEVSALGSALRLPGTEEAVLSADLSARLAAAEERIAGCVAQIAQTGDFFAQAVAEVSAGVADLTRDLGAVESSVLTMTMQAVKSPQDNRKGKLPASPRRFPAEQPSLSGTWESAATPTTATPTTTIASPTATPSEVASAAIAAAAAAAGLYIEDGSAEAPPKPRFLKFGAQHTPVRFRAPEDIPEVPSLPSLAYGPRRATDSAG